MHLPYDTLMIHGLVCMGKLTDFRVTGCDVAARLAVSLSETGLKESSTQSVPDQSSLGLCCMPLTSEASVCSIAQIGHLCCHTKVILYTEFTHAFACDFSWCKR